MYLVGEKRLEKRENMKLLSIYLEVNKIEFLWIVTKRICFVANRVTMQIAWDGKCLVFL